MNCPRIRRVTTSWDAGLRTAPTLVGCALSTLCSATTAASPSPPFSTQQHSPIRPRSFTTTSSAPSSRWQHLASILNNNHGGDWSSVSGGLRFQIKFKCNFGTARSDQRSPYVVLKVSANANKNEIKAAFRKLAKQHHPDLKIHQKQEGDYDTGEEDNDIIMTELINAYEILMNKHGKKHIWTIDARDSRVALACEMYTMDELRSGGMRHVFDIYSFCVILDDISSDCNDDDDDNDVEIHDDVTTTNNKMEGKTVVVEDNETCDDNINNSKQHHYHLDSNPIIPLRAHPDDSISDLKRHIQSNYADTWGLDGQRLDRDGLHLGWELVHCGNNNGLNNDFSSGGSGTSNDGGDMDVLSYHLFVHSYGIRNGDVLHAVVKRRDESS